MSTEQLPDAVLTFLNEQPDEQYTPYEIAREVSSRLGHHVSSAEITTACQHLIETGQVVPKPMAPFAYQALASLTYRATAT